MNPRAGIAGRRTAFGAALVLILSLTLTGNAWALYPTDGTKPDGAGGYMNPADGMCVIGLAADGTMLVDWSITKSRDCVAWTRSADGSVDLVGMTTSAQCTAAGGPGNDGYRHVWSTSLCYDTANSRGISRIDLDNTISMCVSKGGTVVTSGKCVAYGWVYRNRKADNTLPVSGTGISTTDGVQASDQLGFCAASMRMTSATFVDSLTCPSKHNSRATADPVGGPYVEWPDCLSTLTGCQTQSSYDAGLGWSWDTTNSRCLQSFGTIGLINATATKADGTTYAAGTNQDLTVYTNQGDCLANGFVWDNWLPVTAATPTDINSGGEYVGMPPGSVFMKFDALTPVEGGGGEFGSGTGFVCQKCHADQSRSYSERDKPGFPKTRHKMAGDAFGKPFQPYFNAAGSDWGLQGVQCTMCHSTARPGQDDLIQIVPAGVVGPPAAGAPKYATGHNQTEYGVHLLDICYTCHGTPAVPDTVNPAGVIPTLAGDFELTAKGLPPIANQFLNSPHALYTGSSTKVDIGNKTFYGSGFEGYVCRTQAPQFNSSFATPFYTTQSSCQGAGYTWYTTAANGAFCYYDATTCTSNPSRSWTTTFDAVAIPWAADTGGPGGVCYGVGIGSIITTVYRNGVAEKIHNVDSVINPDCSNPGDGSATSGASGFWVKDGETSVGFPTDTAQGNCMTCHDVHWALAETAPEAEPLRRECTTCHTNPGASASAAPQINLATINHLGGTGTPLEHMATKPYEACEVCHMPRSAPTTSPMHLWRINADANYSTLGATQVNTAPDGTYTDAAWVDVDYACGQCHGGNLGPAKPGVPYYTKSALAAVAKGMHASSGVNYATTFTTSIDSSNKLEVDVVAIVDCGGPCPAFTYDWNWGDGSAHGTAQPDSHVYAAGGKYSITLTVLANGLLVGSSTRSVLLSGGGDLPPVVDGTCTWNADTWTMTVQDASTDDNIVSLQVFVDWGDGGSKAKVAPGGTIAKTYGKAGTYDVTQTAIDSKLQAASRTCGQATPGYFTIAGTVYESDGTTPIKGANVVLKKGSVTITAKSTAADGSYLIQKVKPGIYSVKVNKKNRTFAVPAIPSLTVGPSQAGQDVVAQP